MASALPAAKWLCQKSGWGLSNLELQKLLYIAHMLHLGKGNAPLVAEGFEAWDYGPVQPEVYRFVRVFGAEPIGNIFQFVGDLSPNSTEAAALDETLSKLGKAGASRLVAITHWGRGAWAKFYQPGIRARAIPNEAILQEYKERLENAVVKSK